MSVHYKIIKRLLDLFLSIIFLCVFSPIYIITFLIIKVVSPGPVIYKAKRVGINKNIFDCYKFRSMDTNSGKIRITTLQNDERIYPFGHFIRKTKIDEFPQIINIIKGDMSIVGPRPEDLTNVNLLGEKYNEVLTVKPGLTSPASLYDYTHGEKYSDVKIYEEIFLPKKIELELYYVKHKSLLYDFKIILKTIIIIIQTLYGKKDFPIPLELAEGDDNSGL